MINARARKTHPKQVINSESEENVSKFRNSYKFLIFKCSFVYFVFSRSVIVHTCGFLSSLKNNIIRFYVYCCGIEQNVVMYEAYIYTGVLKLQVDLTSVMKQGLTKRVCIQTAMLLLTGNQ